MKRVLCSILVVLALTGCKDDDTNLPFTVPFTPTPPVIQGETAIFYNVTARDPNLNAGAQVFEDGQTPRTLTVTQGSPALSSAMGAPEGFENFFVWDPIQDLGPGLHRDVVVRVFGLQRDLGLPGDTAPLIVDLTDRLDPLTGAPSLEGAVIAPLPDGSVWTAGGLQGGSLSLAGYRYDPRTNTFTASDGLRIARRDASSARLSDGGVLVVGGRDAQGTALAAAEVFRLDAAGNGATRGVPGGLLQARTRPAVAPLQNGQALVVGGATSGGPSPQAERFVPDANGGRFVAAVSDPLLARTAATATRLPDGRVWVAGGFDAGGQPLGSTALVAADGQSVSPGPTLGNPRGEHAAVALPDGRVALVGGTTQAGSDAGASSVVDLFDPDTNQLQNLPNLQRGRRGVGAAYTRGSLIALGGSGQQDTPQTAERLALEDTAWSLIRVPGLARPAARAVRSGAGHVIVVGGAQVPERYWPLGFAATEGFDLVRAPSRPRARHTTTLLNQGFALVAGGTAGIDSGIAGCELFDPRTDTWNDTGSLVTARQDHAAVSIATGVLVVGGRNAQGVVASAELYNAFSGAWEPAGTLLTPRADATATGVGGGRVLVAGGVDAAGNALSSLELWDPVSRSFTAAGSLSAPRGGHDAVATGFHVVLGGGTNALGPLASADVVSAFDLFVGSASEASGRGGAALSDARGSGVVLISGGRANGGTLRDDLRFVDTRVFPFTLLAETKALFVPRADHRMRAMFDRRSLIVGGKNARGGQVDEAELYSFLQALTVQTGFLARTPDRRTHLARVEHTLTPLADRRILIVGGFDELGTALSGAEVYVPR